MALLAMEQYAHLLQSYAPDLRLSDSTEGIDKAISLNQVPVWLPFKMINTCQNLSANWNITSDSLALWLADHLNAEHTMLVKSLSSKNLNARQLSELAMVDKDFPEFVKTSGATVWWLAQNDVGALENLLKTNDKPENHFKAIEY